MSIRVELQDFQCRIIILRLMEGNALHMDVIIILVQEFLLTAFICIIIMYRVHILDKVTFKWYLSHV